MTDFRILSEEEIKNLDPSEIYVAPQKEDIYEVEGQVNGFVRCPNCGSLMDMRNMSQYISCSVCNSIFCGYTPFH